MQVNGPAAALVAATDYTLLVLGSIVVTVFLTSLLLSVIFCRCGARAGSYWTADRVFWKTGLPIGSVIFCRCAELASYWTAAWVFGKTGLPIGS